MRGKIGFGSRVQICRCVAASKKGIIQPWSFMFRLLFNALR